MFHPATSPIASLADIRDVNRAALHSTGIFDPGYFELNGARIVGAPVVQSPDSGHVIVEAAAGYQVLYYQRTRYVGSIGLHNYMEPRTFAHAQSARRYARTF